MNFMERWIAGRMIKRLEDAMGTGWKGKAGGVGLILAGIAGFLTDLSGGGLDVTKSITYWGMLAAGLGMFGIRQAVDTSKEEIQETVVASKTEIKKAVKDA